MAEDKVSYAPTNGVLIVGDRVRLVADTLAWRAEVRIQGKTGVVVECRDGGDSGIKRVTVRFPNGRLLLNRDAASFEVVKPGLKAKTE